MVALRERMGSAAAVRFVPPTRPSRHRVILHPVTSDRAVRHEVRLRWPSEPGPVYVSNQFAGQLASGADGRPENAILTLGAVHPPLLVGTEDEQMQALEQVQEVLITPIVRVALNRRRLDELIKVLSDTRDVWDRAERPTATDGGGS